MRLCRGVAPVLILVSAVGGCSGSARVELAAADALDALAGEFTVALAEYQADLESADAARESAVVAAFIERIRRDGEDDAQVQEHMTSFLQALTHLRGDRRTAWERFDAARDNVAVTQEVARDLRRVALSGLALQAEAKRYIEMLIEAQQSEPRVTQTEPRESKTEPRP